MGAAKGNISPLLQNKGEKKGTSEILIVNLRKT